MFEKKLKCSKIVTKLPQKWPKSSECEFFYKIVNLYIYRTKVVDSKRQAAPAFSFGQRHRPRIESFSPGPLYNITGLGNKGKDTPPAYCLQSRPKEIPKYLTPAPGEYHIENSKMIVKSAPKYTFGVKKTPGSLSSTPAPNEYHIPNILGSSKEGPIRSAPAFTITGRAKQNIPETINYPGPGHYDAHIDPLTKRAPIYSMATRFNVPSDVLMKPGPAAHHPEKVNFGHVPAFSFGIKHSEYLGQFPELPQNRNKLVF